MRSAAARTSASETCGIGMGTAILRLYEAGGGSAVGRFTGTRHRESSRSLLATVSIVTSGIQSAGILLYRVAGEDVEVLIAHPGGPFWARRDAGAWTIPKGLVEDGESLESAARREFMEEIGLDPGPELLYLGSVTLKSRKVVHAWAAEGDFDPDDLDSAILEIEYPHGSGRKVRFPEIDRVIWAQPGVARGKLNPAQADLVDRLVTKLDFGP